MIRALLIAKDSIFPRLAESRAVISGPSLQLAVIESGKRLWRSEHGGSTRYLFTGWSDGGAASHEIVAGAGATSYTATFATQYLLSVSAIPAVPLRATWHSWSLKGSGLLRQNRHSPDGTPGDRMIRRSSRVADLLLQYGHGRSDTERATALLEPAVDRFPHYLGLRFSLAQARKHLGRDAPGGMREACDASCRAGRHGSDAT